MLRVVSTGTHMQQVAADRSLSIRIVTSFVLVLIGGLLIASVYHPMLWFGAGILILVCLACYLLAPVGYALDDHRLTVYSHVHSKQFDSVVRCARIDQPNPWKMWVGIRLFGNGGLFAGVGIFWNRMFGIFRAYVTSARYSDLVLVETTKRKILISPRDPKAFVEAWESSRD
jgi:hypothetical protein